MVWKVKSKIGAAGGDLNMVVHYIPQPYLSREAFVAEDAACPDSGQSLSTAMDSHVGPDAAAKEMAFSRTAPMADSTTIFAVSPNAASDGLHCSGMESSSCGHGETSHLAEALAVSSATSVHSGAPQCHHTEVSDGALGKLHGGRGGDLQAASRENKEPCSPASSPSGRDSQSGSRAGWP